MAGEHTARVVAAQFHRDAFRNPLASHRPLHSPQRPRREG